MTTTEHQNGKPRRPLAADHHAKLIACGIDDHVAERCGIYTEDRPPKIRVLLNWSPNSKPSVLGPCMVLPYFDMTGKQLNYHRLRPSNPLTEKRNDGTERPRKYESPKDRASLVYFAPLRCLHEAMQNAAKPPLFLTEGELKALKACQEGLPTLGVPGVWQWCIPHTRTLKPELAEIDWSGRVGYIVFDSDAATNPQVRIAEYHLALALQAVGARVRIIRLPSGPNGPDGKPGKVGLDDFLIRNSATAVWTLTKDATDPSEPPEPDQHGKLPWEAWTDPHFLARQFMGSYAHNEHPRLAFFRSMYWEWRCGKWGLVPDDTVRAKVVRFCKAKIDEHHKLLNSLPPSSDKPDVAPKVSKSLVSDVLQALTGETLLHPDTIIPSWLVHSKQHTDYIVTANGMLDLTKLFSGAPDYMRPHSPAWFSPIVFPYDFDLTADCPKWMAFLDRNLNGRHSPKATLLQQYAGYLATFDTSHQRFLMMIGEGANGKSVVCAALRTMLGEDNVVSIPLELFGSRFDLETTIGKLANVVAEVGELDRIAEGQLKAFVSGDPMKFEQKFKVPYTARPTARLMMSTNNVPDFRDKSDGLWRRMLLLEFDVQIPEADRIPGMDQAAFWAGERGGILNWALAGLHGLRQAGAFTIPDECRQAVEKMRGETNPARRFLREHYRGGSGWVEKSEVYTAYRDWCENNGHRQLASNKFASEVYRCFKGSKERQVTDGAGRRVRAFDGVIEGAIEGAIP